jgi:Family of unknown function (DUF6282)
MGLEGMQLAEAEALRAELDADRQVADPEVDELLVGAIDMHTHPSPSPFPRRVSVLTAALDAASAGFRAIVCKSHHHNTQMDVLAITEAGLLDDTPIDVYGGIALNHYVGGLNPYAVELCLRMGGRVVWFPTLFSAAHLCHEHSPDSAFRSSAVKLREGGALSILDDEGRIKPEATDILEVIAGEDAVMNAGHLPADEIDVLVPAAVRAGVRRMVVSHPSFVIGATPARTAAWTAQGVTIEQCISPARKLMTLEELRAYITAVGSDHTILSSDYGQRKNPLPVTGFRRLLRTLLDDGMPKEDLRKLVSDNPARILYRDQDPSPAVG